MTSYQEQTCYIPKKRPLREMEDRITKEEESFAVECGPWSDSDLRQKANPKHIVYFTEEELEKIEKGKKLKLPEHHITPNQYRNIKSIAFGTRASDSAYKSHRKGYVFTEKEEELANELQERCKSPNVCAYTIRGETKDGQMVIDVKYGDAYEPSKPFVLEYQKKDDPRDNLHKTAENLEDLKDEIQSFIDDGSANEIPFLYIFKEDFKLPVYFETATIEKDKVNYITH